MLVLNSPYSLFNYQLSFTCSLEYSLGLSRPLHQIRLCNQGSVHSTALSMGQNSHTATMAQIFITI